MSHHAGRRRFLRAAGATALGVCAGVLPDCGYSLAGRGSFLPAYIRVIGVPTFVNRTTLFNKMRKYGLLEKY